VEAIYQGKFEGASPLQKPTPPPSPSKERGIKGVRLLNKNREAYWQA